MSDIIERLEFGCPFKPGTLGEKDAEAAEITMQEAADIIRALRTRAEAAEESFSAHDIALTTEHGLRVAAEKELEEARNLLQSYRDASLRDMNALEAAERERDEFKECYRLAMVPVNDAYDKGYAAGQKDKQAEAAQAADDCHGEASTCGDIIAALPIKEHP